MENNSLPIDDLLQEITLAEGETFTYDREAIIKDLEEQRSAYSNWGISLLSIIGGLLASLALIGFLLMLGLGTWGGSMILIGLLFIAGSVALNKAVKNLLLDTATITFYIAGYGWLIFGLFQERIGDNAVAAFCLLLSVAAIAFSSSAMLVLVSVLIACGSFLSLLLSNSDYSLIPLYIAFITIAYTYVSLYQAKLLATSKAINQRYHPIRVGLLISFVAGLGLLTHADMFGFYSGNQYISAIVIITAILFSIWHISRKLLITEIGKLATLYGISLVVLLPTFFAPSVGGAFLIILLSFYSGHKGGFFGGILALIYFISRYYYDLHFTLLTKSIVLMASGALFLILFFALRKQLQTHESL